jgi:hypothetical protein
LEPATDVPRSALTSAEAGTIRRAKIALAELVLMTGERGELDWRTTWVVNEGADKLLRAVEAMEIALEAPAATQ